MYDNSVLRSGVADLWLYAGMAMEIFCRMEMPLDAEDIEPLTDLDTKGVN